MPTRHPLGFVAAAFAPLLSLLLLPVIVAESAVPGPAPDKPVDLLEQTLGSSPLDNPAPPAEATYTRTFRVDPDSILQLATIPGASITRLQDALHTFLETRGFDAGFDPSNPSRAKLFYNDRTGLLTVRGTLRDLDGIETALATLSITPPQVMIETRFVEFRSDAIDQELAIALAVHPNARLLTAGKTPTLSVLTESETRLLIRVLEQKEGIDMASAPRITTLSGRQARLTLAAPPPIITDPPFTAPGKSPKATWSKKLEPGNPGTE